MQVSSLGIDQDRLWAGAIRSDAVHTDAVHTESLCGMPGLTQQSQVQGSTEQSSKLTVKAPTGGALEELRAPVEAMNQGTHETCQLRGGVLF